MNIDKLLVITSGIFALENPRDHKVYVGYASSDILTHLAAIVKDLRIGGFKVSEMNKDRWELQFKMLEVGSDIETLKLHVQYWEDSYVEGGWIVYDPARRKYLEYKVELEIPKEGSWVEAILYTSKGYFSRVVGRFATMEEAQEFVSGCYTEKVNRYMYPVYAANSLTRELILSDIRGIL